MFCFCVLTCLARFHHPWNLSFLWSRWNHCHAVSVDVRLPSTRFKDRPFPLWFFCHARATEPSWSDCYSLWRLPHVIWSKQASVSCKAASFRATVTELSQYPQLNTRMGQDYKSRQHSEQQYLFRGPRISNTKYFLCVTHFRHCLLKIRNFLNKF